MDVFLLPYFLYGFIGVVAGLSAGLLGIGGGVVTVPALLLVFSMLEFPKDHIMHLAIGTSLSSMVINSFAATYFQYKKKAVEWTAVKRILLGILLGSIAGILVARVLSSEALQVVFGFFAIVMGFVFVKSVKIKETHRIPSFSVLTCIGFFVSSIANLLGIGGGFFMVPIFNYYDFNEKKAIATSSATSFLISLFGAIGYFILDGNDFLAPWCIGYVYLPAFFTIGAVSFIAARFGVKLSHALPAKTLRKIFAATLIAVGLSMIFS